MAFLVRKSEFKNVIKRRLVWIQGCFSVSSVGKERQREKGREGEAQLRKMQVKEGYIFLSWIVKELKRYQKYLHRRLHLWLVHNNTKKNGGNSL